MLEEHVSKKLDVPFVVINRNGERYYLCENGVAFTEEEYLTKFHEKEELQKEYERRYSAGELYDYAYAKNTGFLRKKKRVSNAKEAVSKSPKVEGEAVKQTKAQSEKNTASSVTASVKLMCFALTAVSVGSMYISTVHTATYLLDYVDAISAWTMSAVVTVYCSTAFEVIVLFHDRKRYVLSTVFAVLWALVVTFSMATTVSVFYDRYNFNTIENQTENTEVEGTRLAFELLQKKEADIRHSIALKEEDITYRRSQDYATATVRQELNRLQEDLQSNLTEQQKLLSETPTASRKAEEVTRKESLFAYLGRLLHLDDGVLEFIMSTLSAVFINLISPFTVTTVISLLNKKEE